MKGSSKQKHEDNYWKVLQCLGETTSDAMVKTLVRCELGSCKYHTNRNLFVLAGVFMDMNLPKSKHRYKQTNPLRESSEISLCRSILNKTGNTLSLYRLMRFFTYFTMCIK
jgi:hypothetical protein